MKKSTLGLVGCSQLSLYLSQSAHSYGLFTSGLSSKKSDPAGNAVNMWISGKSNKIKDLKKISQNSQTVFFEEKMNFSIDQLKKNKITSFPSVTHLNLFADLWTTKEILFDFNISQIPYIKMHSSDDFQFAFNFFKKNIVFKNRFSEKNKLDTFLIQNLIQLKNFQKKIKGFENDYIAEPNMDVKSEHRLIVARNKKSQLSSFPVLTLKQTKKQYDTILVSKLNALENKNLKNLLHKVKSMLDKIDYVGVMTIQMFKLKNQFYLYDIDARPTNTGMITMNGFNINQFDLHIRCFLNEDLSEIKQLKSKIICKYIISGQKKYLTPKVLKQNKNIQIFMYGKTGTKKNRKLGHVIFTD